MSDPIDTRAMRQTLGQFATGVTIVTCRGADGLPVGMTANSFASVSLEPPLVLWSVDRKARSFAAFAAAPAFAFSILAQDQVDLSNRFARPGADKFAATPCDEGLDGVPLISGAAGHFECVQETAFDGGDHLIIVGRVRRFARFEKPCLVFAQGRYGAIAAHPGPAPEQGSAIEARHPYDDFLVPLLFRAYNHLFAAFSGALAERDATGGQMRMLAILAESPCGEDSLLTRTMLSQSRFSEARQRLVAARLVAEVPAGLEITEAGRERLMALLHQAAAREQSATEALDAAEVAHLKSLLRKLVRHHEADD
ncbi:flavin reductase [Acuticoccus sp. MNP-M23]|uniref:flavin reductase n=1 Tax=Acuticoccus sp. MNP-M23 TaxID=3072793 RepID=UPI002814F7BC|nr:flavin reductase [Acuticoccus sp. MNP-M23]WMS41461.1 flavin reductase [Acuticoccus sp. MNP-M23]